MIVMNAWMLALLAILKAVDGVQAIEDFPRPGNSSSVWWVAERRHVSNCIQNYASILSVEKLSVLRVWELAALKLHLD